MKRRNTMQGPVLCANVYGLTNGGTGLMQKAVFTGFKKAVFLNQSDITTFNDGQVEIANCDSYSVGNVRNVSARNGELTIKMWHSISGHGHPPSRWESFSGCEFVVELADYDFAYVGTGGNGGGNRLFVQSTYHLPGGGIFSVTLFPPDGKPINPLTVDNLRAMWYRTTSVTVLPPKPKEESSLFWRRPKPWVREYINAFGD